MTQTRQENKSEIEMVDWEKIVESVTQLPLAARRDIVLYNGPIGKPYDEDFRKMCRENRKALSVLLILVTSGGDAHAAYRMGRSLQRYYDDNVEICVPGWCKSAGTLLCTSAKKLYVGDYGELGPIDIQQATRDELWRHSSGLTENAAIGALEDSAILTFQRMIVELTEISGGQITFRTAADISAKLVGELIGPIVSQIDPIKIGENSRATSIAYDYGRRLGRRSKNLKNNTMRDLVSSYSSHGFVIDRDEADFLFVNVASPDADMEKICEEIGERAYIPFEGVNAPPKMLYLTRRKDDDRESKDNEVWAAESALPSNGNNGRHHGNAKASEAPDPDTEVETEQSDLGNGE